MSWYNKVKQSCILVVVMLFIFFVGPLLETTIKVSNAIKKLFSRIRNG